MRFHLYIAASLDGFIAGPNGEVDWLGPFNGVDYGYKEFFRSVGPLLMGRKSFDLARTFKGPSPYAGHRTMVVSARGVPDPPKGIEVTSDLDAAISELRDAGENVWVMGGGELVRSMIERDALDVLEIYLIPVVLGSGIPLFPPGTPERGFRLERSSAFPNGVVKTVYVPEEAKSELNH